MQENEERIECDGKEGRLLRRINGELGQRLQQLNV